MPQTAEKPYLPPLLSCTREEAEAMQAELNFRIRNPNPEPRLIRREALLNAHLIDFHVAKIQSIAQQEEPDTILLGEHHEIAVHGWAQTRLALLRNEDLGLEASQNRHLYCFERLKKQKVATSKRTAVQSHLEKMIPNPTIVIGVKTIMAPETKRLQAFLIENASLRLHFNDALCTSSSLIDPSCPDNQKACKQSKLEFPVLEKAAREDDIRNREIAKKMGEIQQTGGCHVAGRKQQGKDHPYETSILAHAQQRQKKIISSIFHVKDFGPENLPSNAKGKVTYAPNFNGRKFTEKDTNLENQINAEMLRIWGFKEDLFANFKDAVTQSEEEVRVAFQETLDLYHQGHFGPI